MANQNRRSHAPSKTKRGKSFGEPRENRNFSRPQDENSDRQGRHYGKPKPGKPSHSKSSGPKLTRFQEDETGRLEQRHPGKPKPGKPVPNQKAIGKVLHNRKAERSSARPAGHTSISEANNGRTPAPSLAKRGKVHKDRSHHSFDAAGFKEPRRGDRVSPTTFKKPSFKASK